MSRSRTKKASRHIPEHIKRAVNARDGRRCRNCGVVTEFIHYDHIFPYDLGGPTTVSNIQSLCPTCNTSKGNKITCRNCGHWISPDKTHCTQCGERLGVTKRSNTLAGKLEKGNYPLTVGIKSAILFFVREIADAKHQAQASKVHPARH